MNSLIYLDIKEDERLKKSAQRIKALINGDFTGVKMTLRELSTKIGVCDATIRNYVHRRTPLSERSAGELEKLTGYRKSFWLGIDDDMTLDEHERTLSRIRLEKIGSLHAQMGEIIKERELFFRRLGYRYECHPDAVVDFIFLDCLPNETAISVSNSVDCELTGRHTLTRYSDGRSASFTGEELRDMMQKLSSVLSYFCYEKEEKHGQQ